MKRSAHEFCALFVLLLLYDVIDVTRVVADDSVSILDEQAFAKKFQEEPYFLLLFNSGNKKCQKCETVLRTLQNIDLSIPLYTTSCQSLVRAFSISSLPSLLYVRHQRPILYSGDLRSHELTDDIQVWLETSTDVCTQSLNDETFEHLTQVSTGATTGHWLVLFHTPECTQLMAVLDAVCHSVKHRMNVATVNLQDSPESKHRFNIHTCSKLIFFRQGKMYQYDVEDYTVSSLEDFVTSWYTNVKSELIPLITSPFDKLVEGIASRLKKEMEGPNKPLIIAGCIAGTVVMAAVLVIVCRPGHHHGHEHKD